MVLRVVGTNHAAGSSDGGRGRHSVVNDGGQTCRKIVFGDGVAGGLTAALPKLAKRTQCGGDGGVVLVGDGGENGGPVEVGDGGQACRKVVFRDGVAGGVSAAGLVTCGQIVPAEVTKSFQ